MNKKKLWIAAFSLLFGSIAVSAQEQRIKEEGKTEFKSHWFCLLYTSDAADEL